MPWLLTAGPAVEAVVVEAVEGTVHCLARELNWSVTEPPDTGADIEARNDVRAAAELAG